MKHIRARSKRRRLVLLGEKGPQPSADAVPRDGDADAPGMAQATAAVEEAAPAAGASRTVTLSGPLRTRRPRRRAAAWDDRPRRRLRRTGADGPCGDGPRAPLGPRASTCDDGSRGAWPASCCSAGTSASLTASSTGACRVMLAPHVFDRCTSMRVMRFSTDQTMRVELIRAVRARKTRRLAGPQGRGRPGQRQRALWIAEMVIGEIASLASCAAAGGRW